MPSSAYKRGRPPRERARKRQARTDLIDGLDRSIRARSFISLPAGAEATHEGAISLWIAWAARLGETGLATAPDGTEWRVSTRWELL